MTAVTNGRIVFVGGLQARCTIGAGRFGPDLSAGNPTLAGATA